jgi:DNA-binding protein YbaB
MSFFDQLKQIKELKDMQDKLSQEEAVVEREGISVKVNGKMEVQNIILNPALDTEKQQRILKDCINEALKKVQMAAAQKLFQGRQ